MDLVKFELLGYATRVSTQHPVVRDLLDRTVRQPQWSFRLKPRRLRGFSLRVEVHLVPSTWRANQSVGDDLVCWQYDLVRRDAMLQAPPANGSKREHAPTAETAVVMWSGTSVLHVFVLAPEDLAETFAIAEDAALELGSSGAKRAADVLRLLGPAAGILSAVVLARTAAKLRAEDRAPVQ